MASQRGTRWRAQACPSCRLSCGLHPSKVAKLWTVSPWPHLALRLRRSPKAGAGMAAERVQLLRGERARAHARTSQGNLSERGACPRGHGYRWLGGHVANRRAALATPLSVPMTLVSSDVADDSTGAVQPLWIKLIDPVTSSPFWFHRRFRSRRDEAPAADDDGSIGAWTGEPEAKRFVRCLDGPTKHAYYVDLAAVTTSWVRPAEFDSVGISLPSAVGAPEHPDALAATPHFPVELLVGRTFRDGTWWAEKRGGGKHFYSSTAFRKRMLVTRAGALSYFKSEAVSQCGCSPAIHDTAW